jgi:hypothetical protein
LRWRGVEWQSLLLWQHRAVWFEPRGVGVCVSGLVWGRVKGLPMLLAQHGARSGPLGAAALLHAGSSDGAGP